MNVQFGTEKLTWKSYTIAKTLPTTGRLKLIDKREFTKVVLDQNSETFVIHVVALEVLTAMPIYSFRTSQIQDDPTLATLQYDKTFTEIPAEYSDYANVFSLDLAIELSVNTGMNEHVIKLIDNKQPLYGPIYALSPVELESLKTYIKTHLKTGFIQSFKSPTGALILFDKKLDGTLRLCVNYQGINNLTIKNRYLLPLIGEVLDWVGRAEQFTQLDLTCAYHWMRIQEGDK